MRWPLIVLFVSLAACASDNKGASEFQHALDDAHTELGRHLSGCNAATTDTAMSQEVVRHDEAMQSLMHMMSTNFEQMHCYHGEPAAMKGLMAEVSDAEQTHHQRMTDSNSLDEAQAECQSYVNEANGDIDQMHGRFQHDGAQCMMM